MADKNVKTNEEVVEQVEETKEQPTKDEKVTFKVKPRVKKNTDEVIKVDLRKKPEQEENVTEEKVEEATEEKVEEQTEAVLEEIKDETEATEEQEEKPVIEEVTEEENKTETQEENVETVEQTEQTPEQPAVELPENVDKLVKFMEETGGDIEDYVKLNADYSKYDDQAMLREYYRQTKPHLTSSEIDFLIEDDFTYDEEVDDPKDVKRKKLAFKEQVASARGHMDKLKSSYYAEIKSGVKLTPEQQKAVDFFNRYNNEKQESDKLLNEQQQTFQNKTNELFKSDFKGFEYNVGDKRYRFNVKNAEEVKTQQSDINNFVKRFVDKKNMMSDASGYHKSLFTAMNADAVANHFYEQGKADGIKQSMANAKNVDMTPRTAAQDVEAGGIKVRAISGDTTSKLRVKMRK